MAHLLNNFLSHHFRVKFPSFETYSRSRSRIENFLAVIHFQNLLKHFHVFIPRILCLNSHSMSTISAGTCPCPSDSVRIQVKSAATWSELTILETGLRHCYLTESVAHKQLRVLPPWKKFILPRFAYVCFTKWVRDPGHSIAGDCIRGPFENSQRQPQVFVNNACIGCAAIPQCSSNVEK